MKDLKTLGQALSKEEQKNVFGGLRDPFGPENWPETNGGCNPQSQCLNDFGRCTSRMNCNCTNQELNHYSCGV